MTDPEVEELKNREQNSDSGSVETPDPTTDPDDSGFSLPIPSRYLVLGVVVIVALLAWQLTSDDDSDDSDDLTTETEVSDDQNVTLRIPEGAGQKEKDKAVLSYLQETGRMGG